MNHIDVNFNNLVSLIRSQSLEEVYSHIRDCFLRINPNIQISLQDYFEKFSYWGKIQRESGNYEELYNRSKSLKENIDDYVWLYSKLGDYRSKKLLFAIMNNWYNFDFDTLRTCFEGNYSHYFDLDIVKCDENEVFVDLGAYTGDTVIDYLTQYGANKYKKIYCYEITSDIFEQLKNNLCHFKNIKCIQKGVSDKKESLYVKKSLVDYSANTVSDDGDEEIQCVTIDDDIDENITMIKMDIEGFEQRALMGCQRHIINEHPKLLISVYHNHEDIFKIPVMIENMCKGYHFYLRYYGNNIFPTETVLLAIYDNKKAP